MSAKGSGAGAVESTAKETDLVRTLIVLVSIALGLVLLGAAAEVTLDLGPVEERGLERFVGYGSRGLIVVMMATLIGIVVFGFAYTVVEAAKRFSTAVVVVVRFVMRHSLRHLVDLVAPIVLPVGWFIGFSLVTGGTEAIGYWLSAAVGSVALGVGGYYALLLPYFLLWQLGEGLGSLVAALVSRGSDEPSDSVKEAVSLFVRIGPLAVLYVLFWVRFAAIYSGTTPSRLPWTEYGWGQFLGFLTLVGTTWGMGFLGFYINDRWEDPEVEADSPSAPSPPPVPTRSTPMTVAMRPVAALPQADPEPEELWSPQAIVGWRAWLWTGEELRGVWRSWNTSDFEAECAICNEVPGWDHTCGIYAVKQRWKLIVFDRPAVRDRMVIGKVELSGLVVEHEAGYRAQHARIVELIAPPSLVSKIRSKYPDVLVKEGPENGVLWPT